MDTDKQDNTTDPQILRNRFVQLSAQINTIIRQRGQVLDHFSPALPEYMYGYLQNKYQILPEQLKKLEAERVFRDCYLCIICQELLYSTKHRTHPGCKEKYQALDQQVIKTRFDVAKKSATRKRKRANRKRWELTLVQYTSLLKKRCYYCKWPNNSNYIGLDRIDNAIRVYRIDNVLPCCTECNLARNTNFTVEAMIKYIGPSIAKAKQENKDRRIAERKNRPVPMKEHHSLLFDALEERARQAKKALEFETVDQSTLSPEERAWRQEREAFREQQRKKLQDRQREIDLQREKHANPVPHWLDLANEGKLLSLPGPNDEVETDSLPKEEKRIGAFQACRNIVNSLLEGPKTKKSIATLIYVEYCGQAHLLRCVVNADDAAVKNALKEMETYPEITKVWIKQC